MSIDTHKLWIEADRPKHGSVYENKSKAKAAYKLCVRNNQQKETSNISNALHDALINKSNGSFWKVWNSKFGNKKNHVLSIDGCSADEEIANNFAKYFSKTCDVNSIEKNKHFSEVFSQRIMQYVGDVLHDAQPINICMIDEIIGKMTTGKASGTDGLSVEHLKHSHPILFSILTKLFNLMICVEYVPDAFGIGLTIPIPKGDSHVKNYTLEDFRGITISPVLSKVFENCLLMMMNNYLTTSDMQFGFKKNLSCAHAIYVVRSTVEYFNHNNSTVNLCAIDICKAFDKVNHSALFLKLMDRNVPRSIVLILKCWYDKIYTTVKWNLSFSNKVKLSAGIRQGGILSPYLFALFVDSILYKLKKSSLGCHISRMCYNAIMYADDLLLLSISLKDLQAMVDLCIAEFDLIDLKINIKKSMCMRIGNKHKDKIKSVVINNLELEWKQEIRYLGVFFVSANIFKCNLQSARQKFFKALNGIFAKIGTNGSPNVILSLVNSYCLPVLLYGTECLIGSQKIYNSLDNAYRTIFAKIFKTFDNDVIANCMYYCGMLPMHYTADIRKFKFYNSLLKASNFQVKLLFHRTGIREFEQLCNKYNLAANNTIHNLKRVMWRDFEKLIES